MKKGIEKDLHDMMMKQYDLGINDCKRLIIEGFESVKEKGNCLLSCDQIIDIIKNIKE